jgi:UDP-N-acetylmuramate dehydrogenase
MKPTLNAPLAPLTSLAAGGIAERLYTCTTDEQIESALSSNADGGPIWTLGYGANALISDKGLPGITILVRTTGITRQPDSTIIVAEAGEWWDNVVKRAIRESLWGLELTSGIPGSTGAAVVGNIAAYGQAVADTLLWVEVLDTTTGQVRQIPAASLGLGYRFSSFQTDTFQGYIILRAAFQLNAGPTTDLTYQTALDIAAKHKHDIATLKGRRQTVLKTRESAGSLWDYRHPDKYLHTAGSFFRNPLVDAETADRLMSFDETGRSAELLRKMNQVHGGAEKRVSAAHVLLAAGFSRGQTWGPVRLHPDHILKIENTGGATAQNIYDVAMEIVDTVREKLGIELQPEVRFLGEFHD